MSDLHTQCSSCGDVLATDSRAGLCEPCATIAQATPDAAPVLSVDFWEQPEIRSALLSRHFGRFLRTYRTAQSPQVKQTQLAHWLGITQGQLSRIERSTTPLHDLHKLDTWARALHVPDDRLWFSPSPTPTSSGVDAVAPDRATVEKSLHNAHNEGSAVRRRDLLKVAGVTAAAAGVPGFLPTHHGNG
jgi:transcriptional regulator with XRE-family HTH domain